VNCADLPSAALPLSGVRVVEFEGLGPAPLVGRILSDMGALVTVIAKPQGNPVAERLGGTGENPLRRGKTVEVTDLKTPSGFAYAMSVIGSSDVLIEGNRPGVMERLGLGPDECGKRNPKLVYGRMTGWGQTGPLAQVAGHDLNYVALSGMLSLATRGQDAPMIPPTVLGDGAGALGLAFGVVCALLDARSSGKGRVVDAAILDIVSMLGSIALWIRGGGQIDGNGASPFHGSAFYDVYECADGKFVTAGALEPQFYALLLQKLGIKDVDPALQYDRTTWASMKTRVSNIFRSKPRAEWCALLEGTDACFSPVLTLDEAAAHSHNVARGNFSRRPDGGLDTSPAPRFSFFRTDGQTPSQ
jgi:alpha-methylacyl-CoA racemase